jgi:hypothetical protein
VDGEAAFAASGTCIARVESTLVVATGGARSRIQFSGGDGVEWKQMPSRINAGSESRGVFSVAATGLSGDFIAVGGDFRAEGTPADAVRFVAVETPVPGHARRDGGVAPASMTEAGFDAKPLPATPGYRSGIACAAGTTTCIAVGPTGVDAWNGSDWRSISTTGYDAIDITGNIGWASGDDGRVARIEIDD